MDGGLKKELHQFMSGMKIFVAANKREYGASLDEGKRAMSFEVFKRLCEELYNGKGDDHYNGMEFNGEKRQLCQYACAAHPVEVG